MPQDRQPDTLAPYRKAVQDFGPSFEATLWASKPKQLERFAVLSAMGNLAGKVVLDAGCGMGDLALWLHTNNIPVKGYVGLEGVPQMADAAANHVANNVPFPTQFLAGDFVTDRNLFTALRDQHNIDAIAFSGSLNAMPIDTALAVLQTAWNAQPQTLVFNFLSSAFPNAKDDPESPAHRFDPAAVLTWALKQTPLTQLRHDYMAGHDATISMTRE